MDKLTLIKMLKHIEEVSQRDMTCEQEGFDAHSFSGGNYDDAYDLGLSDGYIEFARELMEKYF